MAVVLPLCALVAVSGTSSVSGSGVLVATAADAAVRDTTTGGVVDATVFAAVDVLAVEDAPGLAEALPVAEASTVEVDEDDAAAFAVAEFALVCVIAVPLAVTWVPPVVTGVPLATGVVVTEPLAAAVLFAPAVALVAAPVGVVADVADAWVGCGEPFVAGCTWLALAALGVCEASLAPGDALVAPALPGVPGAPPAVVLLE